MEKKLEKKIENPEKTEFCAYCGKELRAEQVIKRDAYKTPYCSKKCYLAEDEFR
jgi:DNA-directed RNA polymerase subunit RPC12/RpoP